MRWTSARNDAAPTRAWSGPRRVTVAVLLLAAAVGVNADWRHRATTASAESPARHGSHELGGHEDEGFALRPARSETVRPGGGCVSDAPVRSYRVVAINADISLNRYLDHDPEGRMYVLEEDLERVRRELDTNERARGASAAEPAVSLGLQGDAIQPLTLRVLPGECLRIRLRTALRDEEPATIHVHGTSLTVRGTRRPAVAGEARAVARHDHPVDYEWYVPPDEPEATHYFHSHGNTRVQTSHGLFGAVVVEPRGSRWLDPLSGRPVSTGWASMVVLPDGSAFREFVAYYHEIGDETFQPLDRNGQLVPQVDPLTHIYRPTARALNYRSEPFMNRLALQQARDGRFDESLEYSSYSFGDPATPVMRTYLGDQVRQRVVHGGSEVFHVHHVHGGGIRWRRDFGVEPAGRNGLDKRPPLTPAKSERTDSSTLGPSEAIDLQNECGAGGCQLSPGDFMYHCHVTEHYFAGMWGIWRVYNTLQDGQASTDGLPPLRPLPSQRDAPAAGVTSDKLAGTTVDWHGQRHDVGDVQAWVRRQLPPPGTPAGYDASVWDWTFDGNTAIGEPETSSVWPAYRARAPGLRPPILFDPRSGKPAYPFLRPHLAARPPFAPGHGPAPFLDPPTDGRSPPAPGASGPGSVCPAGSEMQPIAINAITAPVVQSRKLNIVDSRAQMYVRRDQLDAVRRDESLRRPLTIRTNAQDSCLDVLYRSELEDSPDDPFNKSGLHVHFMQFDIQGSDGVDVGFNYEQTVRPFRLASRPLTAPARRGATSVTVSGPAEIRPGALLGVGMEMDGTFEVATVAAVDPGAGVVTLAAPLVHDHGAGELVGTEFVRYRFFPDVQFGTAFFHDHVNVPFSGAHGLYGAVISEPPGATWRSPQSGEEVLSGPVADIHSDGSIGAGVDGSFREIVVGLQDDNTLSHVGRSAGSAVSTRVEPLDRRRATADDPARLFSSAVYGDPETPMLEAYVGDPVAFRAFVGANNEVHSLHIDGHPFRVSPFDATSPLTNNVHLGISERADIVIPAAGGPQRMPGDYLWYNGRSLKLREGSWGLLRVLGPADAGTSLRRLPGHEETPLPAEAVCPADAARREFDVSAIDVALPMLDGKNGKIFVLESRRVSVERGDRPATPLVLRVDVSDCVEVRLTNRTKAGPVSFHADRMAADPRSSAGVEAGRNPSQAVAPGESRTYELYAAPQLGEGTAMVRDFGDVLVNPALGLYGAIVVGPRGARYVDPASGREIREREGWRVDVHPAGDAAPYRDVALFLQDEDEGIGNHKMPYTTSVEGPAAINYASAPLGPRLSRTEDPASVLSLDGRASRPATPVVDVRDGDAVRLHVLAPSSEQAQVFSVDGHRWRTHGSGQSGPFVSSATLAGLDVLDIDLEGGAGGPARLRGDYVFGNHREPYREAGQWGVLRVVSCSENIEGLTRFDDGRACSPTRSARTLLGATAALGALALALIFVRSRRRHRRFPASANASATDDS